MYSGPNTGTNNLVFGYDTGRFDESHGHHDLFRPHQKHNGRHYGGEASINHIAFQNAVPQDTYTSYSATSSGTWNAKHPNAITAFNAQGNSITGYVNGGVGDYTNTYHAHWQLDPILNKPVVVMDAFDGNWKAKSFGTGLGSFAARGLGAGTKYVISWLQYTTNLSKGVQVGLYTKNTSNGNGFHDGMSSNGVTSRNTKINTWERVYHVYTVSSNRNLSDTMASIYMYGQYFINGMGITIKIADVQMELNTDTPTDYMEQPNNSTTAQRNSSNTLIDVKRNVTINTSNMSFNSEGFMTFDGTDDYLDFGSDETYKTGGGWTVESIVRYNSVAGSYNNVTSPANFIGSESILYNSWYWSVLTGRLALWNRSPGVWKYGSTTLQPNTWYHTALVCSDDGTSYQMYLNGVPEGGDHTTYSWNPSYSGLMVRYIGRGSNSNQRRVNGDIPVTKIYNKVLTDLEIKQNYLGFKERFH